MREENYFEKKLETCKETLAGAKTKINDLDIQMMKLKERFEHDKKVYNDQTIHMQNTIKDMEKRIPELKKKLKAGYTTIDMRTGKAFKSFKERHIEHLKEKIKQFEENQKLIEANYQRKQELKKKKRLTPEQQETVKAEAIRVDMEGEDEIKIVYEQQIENLKKKKETYEQQLAELQQKKKNEKDLKEVVKELEKEEDAVIVKISIPDSEKEYTLDDLEKELERDEVPEGKAECPECHEYFTKGGAFAAHYKSHFNRNESE